jgi:hypothetical protein
MLRWRGTPQEYRFINDNNNSLINRIKKTMKNILKFLSLSALLSAQSAFAAPENGWWWNPQAPGTGYNIETQNGTLFVATFVYDNNGNPIWYSGSGQIGGGTTVTVNLQRSEGGPCLGCTFSAAKTSNSGYQVTLSFSDDGHGFVTANGHQTPIERFNFNFGEGLSRILGVWVISFPTISGATNGFGLSDMIAYSQVSNGGAIGKRVSGGASAVVQTDDPNIYVSATRISTQENMASIFTLHGMNAILGITAIVSATASGQEAANEIKTHGKLLIGFRGASTSDIPGQVTTSAHAETLAAEDPQTLDTEDASNITAEISLLVDSDTLEAIKGLTVSHASQP